MSVQRAPASLPEMPGEDDLPHTFGPPLETELHRTSINALIDSLRLWWRDRDDFFAGGNMAMYFSAQQLKKNDFVGPDVFVVLDTDNHPRKSWVVWQELRTPDVVVEMMSPSTEARDRGEKMKIYAQVLKVPEYYLFDPSDGRFEGYHLDFQHLMYVAIPPWSDGSIPCTRLGLRLCVVSIGDDEDPGYELRWMDPAGNVVPTPQERVVQVERQADEEQKRAEKAERRADRQTRRAARLEALLKQAGLDLGEE